MKFSVTCYVRAFLCARSTFAAIKMFPKTNHNRKEAHIRNMRKGQDKHKLKALLITLDI